MKNGDCIGGFTSKSWTATSSGHEWDQTAMLFNLSKSKLFPSNPNLGVIMHSIGPSFGDVQLFSNEPFNGEGKC
jgi:hypothetical protein